MSERVAFDAKKLMDRAPSAPGPAEWFAGTGWLMVGIVAVASTRNIPFMSPFGPGPGFFPQILGYILAILAGIRLSALVVLWRQAATHARTEADRGPTTRGGSQLSATGGLFRFAGLACCILIYSFLLEPIGFLLATTLFCWSNLMFMQRKALPSFAGSVAAAAALQLAFGTFLGVQLPAADLGLLATLGL